MGRAALLGRALLPRLGGVVSAALFLDLLVASDLGGRVLGAVGFALSLAAICVRGESARRRSAAAIVALLVTWGGIEAAFRPYVLLFVLPTLATFVLLSSPLVATSRD